MLGALSSQNHAPDQRPDRKRLSCSFSWDTTFASTTCCAQGWSRTQRCHCPVEVTVDVMRNCQAILGVQRVTFFARNAQRNRGWTIFHQTQNARTPKLWSGRSPPNQMFDYSHRTATSSLSRGALLDLLKVFLFGNCAPFLVSPSLIVRM